MNDHEFTANMLFCYIIQNIFRSVHHVMFNILQKEYFKKKAKEQAAYIKKVRAYYEELSTLYEEEKMIRRECGGVQSPEWSI